MKLSRSALEEFLCCPRCFWLHRRRGIRGLRRIPLTLAVATDALLKNEFDAVRASGARHPVWKHAGLDVRAYSHPDLDTWRSNFKGVRVVHAATGATISGAVDDLWQDRGSGALHVVDYKSTSKQGTPTLEGAFGAGYRRQVEIYQWLLRAAGFAVSPVAWFLCVNGIKEGGFYAGGQGRMTFSTTLLAHQGDDSWVNDCITSAVACYRADEIPASGTDCDTCRYVADRAGT